MIQKKFSLTGHSGAIYDLAYKENTNELFSGSYDNKIIAWDLENPEVARLVAKVVSKPISILYLPKHNFLVIGQANGNISLVNLTMKKEIAILKHHLGMVYTLNVSEDESLLYSGGEDGTIAKWDLSNNSLLISTPLNSLKIREIEWVNDLLYVGCGKGNIMVLNPFDLTVVQTLDNIHLLNYSVYTLLYLKERDILLSGSRDGHIAIIDINTHQLLEKIPAHNFAVYKLSSSLDGKYIASASRDKSIKIWKRSNMEFQKKVDYKGNTGHKGSVNSILWLDNSLISCSDDQQIIIWEYNKGQSF